MNDFLTRVFHNRTVPRRDKIPAAGPPQPDWYLADWMRTLRVSQADLVKRTGWGKSQTNDLYHGRTEFYRKVAIEAAHALNLQLHELFMHPDDAMAIRQMLHAQRRFADSPTLSAVAEEPLSYDPGEMPRVLPGKTASSG